MNINTKEFLKQSIEGYLFNDVGKMLEIKLNKSESCGACGYPIIMSILSGMELLGGLLDNETFNRNQAGKYENKGSKYFDNYWEQCLCEQNEIYKIKNITGLIRNLIRHGLAHNFLTKPGILILINGNEHHWKIDKNENFLSISCVDFYNDFKNSYYKYFLKKNEKNKERAQARLKEMIDDYLVDSKNLFSKIDFANLPEETKMSINIDRTIGSPAYKIKDMISFETSCTPLSAAPSGMWETSVSGNFPIFKEEFFPKGKDNLKDKDRPKKMMN